MVRARRKNPADGRSENGGSREGTPGTPYAQRSDLRSQKITVPKSNEYGQGEQLRRAQQAVPMAGAPPVPTPGGAGGAAPAGPVAASPPDLYRSTERPEEHVMAGLPVGPGPGPSALPMPQTALTDPLAIQLRALYQRFPSQELADLLMDLQ